MSRQAEIPILYTVAIQAHRQKTCTLLQKHPAREKATSPLDSLRSAYVCMWWWQPTVYQYCTWICCERAWKPRTASGCSCKHSNSAGMLLSAISEKMLLYHQPTDTAQTFETVMNVAALTAVPWAPNLQAPKSFPYNLYGIDNIKKKTEVTGPFVVVLNYPSEFHSNLICSCCNTVQTCILYLPQGKL